MASASTANSRTSPEESELDYGGASGMREACGLFGIVATGDWPCDINLSHLIHLGLVGLQHRCNTNYMVMLLLRLAGWLFGFLMSL